MSHPPSKELSPKEQRTIIFGIMLSMFLAALDQTIVAPALPTIGASLGDMTQLSWVVTAYLLSATAVTPLYGKLADTYGRRPTLATAVGIFAASSILCALAPSVPLLAGARAIQGLGGGGLIVLAQTIIGDAVPPRERARYQALIASVFASASIAGPIFGGFFAEHLSWPFIFWINVPFGIVAIVVMNRALQNLPAQHRPHRLDLLGALLMLGGTVSLLLGLTWGGVRFPWTSDTIIGLLGGFVVLAVLFFWRMMRAAEPLVPLDVMRSRVVTRGTLAASFGMGGFVGLVVHVPLYLERVLGLSASEAGLALMALMIGTPIGATLSSRVMLRSVHYKRGGLVGCTVSLIALVLIAWLEARLPLAALEVLLCLVGMGLGSMFPISTVAVQNAVEGHQMGTATGVLNFTRQLVSAIAVAAFATIMLGTAGPAGLIGEMQQGQANAADIAALALGYRFVFVAAAVCIGLGLLNLILLEELPLRGSRPAAAAASSEA